MSVASVTSPVVDAHHHLWRYAAEEFVWIDTSMTALQRDFRTAELICEMNAADVDLAVAVQARTTLEETASLLEQARREPRLAGVVGWLPLGYAGALDAALERFGDQPRLVAVRHGVQDEAAGFLGNAQFNHGIDRITSAGLAYDLLVRADQLREVATFVDRHPHTTFVLDHVAKPRIRRGELEPWRAELTELAQRSNVACKLSGMVTEADWQHWRSEDLTPYFAAALAAFGPQRLLAGSDWPVVLLASPYARWWSVLRDAIAQLSAGERAAILGGNAVRLYGLKTEAH